MSGLQYTRKGPGTPRRGTPWRRTGSQACGQRTLPLRHSEGARYQSGGKETGVATYVLVHDAFQGGWVWGKVASILRWEKNEVYTPTLTGCGDRSHLLREGVDLHTYMNDLTNFFSFENLSSVVLVSHGYSGMVTSGVIQSMPHLPRKVIYLDGVIPEQGKSFLNMAGEGFGHVLNSHLHNGWMVKPWPSISHGISRSTDKQWFESRLVNFPLAAFITPFPGNFDPSLFDLSCLHCKESSGPLSGNTGLQAELNGWSRHELESGHLPMVSAPDKLAELLMALGG
jgi:pimeloyl-ACP methyl ester carboxylesterase